MSDLTQRDLFAPSFGEALAARDEAVTRVAANAEEASPGFAEAARAFVLARLARGPATAEDLTDAAIAAGIIPHDLRAFGPVILSLSRARLIVKAGHCARRRGHNTAGGNLWKLSEQPPEREP